MEDYSVIPHDIEQIKIQTGKFQMAADLILPAVEYPVPALVFVWGSGPASREMVGRPSQLITAFLEAGCAVLIHDKPGSGQSSGQFDPASLLSERADILLEESKVLQAHPAVKSVGFYGSSQAAYVMAMAIEQGAGPDFLAAVSCPMQNSVEQSAYLTWKQLLCAGYGDDKALNLREAYIARDYAGNYADYLTAAQLLDADPIVRDELNWGGIIAEADFEQHPADWDEYYDPADIYRKLDIPLLAIFGEKDTQIDPFQGSRVLKDAVWNNPASKLVLLQDTDHNMRPAETGCLREQRENYSKPGGLEYKPEFLTELKTWLKKLSSQA